MIHFACACGRELRAPDDLAGRQVRCPACGQTQPVPQADARVQPEDAPRSAGPPPEAVRRERPARADRREEPEPAPAGAPATSGKAIGSLVLGLLSLGCLALTGLPAVILGALALRDVNRSRGRLSGH